VFQRGKEFLIEQSALTRSNPCGDGLPEVRDSQSGLVAFLWIASHRRSVVPL